eukprot:8285258-Karenia_brevis.AAC.1
MLAAVDKVSLLRSLGNDIDLDDGGSVDAAGSVETQGIADGVADVAISVDEAASACGGSGHKGDMPCNGGAYEQWADMKSKYEVVQ